MFAFMCSINVVAELIPNNVFIAFLSIHLTSKSSKAKLDLMKAKNEMHNLIILGNNYVI